MRRLLPNVLLLLMLVFLLPVYLVKQRPDLLGLGVLLLAAAFFVVYTNQPRSLEMVAGITLVLSFVGTAFWGQLLAGPNGGYCFVGLWMLALFGIVVLMFRRAVFVERGQIVVINQLPENRAIIWKEGMHRPLRPFVERRMAALPSYELDIELTIPHLNTRSLANIDEIKLMVRYRIVQPRDTVFNFPNREQASATLAAERRAPDDRDTDGQVAFWSELIRRQMAVEIEQAVRIVIAGIAGPAEIGSERESVARTIRQHLQTSVARWGIELLDLQLLDVLVDVQRLRMANRGQAAAAATALSDRPEQVGQVELHGPESRATATAKIVADMLRARQQQGNPLGDDEIERIVLTALGRSGIEN